MMKKILQAQPDWNWLQVPDECNLLSFWTRIFILGGILWHTEEIKKTNELNQYLCVNKVRPQRSVCLHLEQMTKQL